MWPRTEENIYGWVSAKMGKKEKKIVTQDKKKYTFFFFQIYTLLIENVEKNEKLFWSSLYHSRKEDRVYIKEYIS